MKLLSDSHQGSEPLDPFNSILTFELDLAPFLSKEQLVFCLKDFDINKKNFGVLLKVGGVGGQGMVGINWRLGGGMWSVGLILQVGKGGRSMV